MKELFKIVCLDEYNNRVVRTAISGLLLWFIFSSTTFAEGTSTHSITLLTEHAPEIEITISSDIEVLVPLLSKQSLDLPLLAAVLSFSGIPEADASYNSYFEEKTFSLGDAIPYFTLAVDTAFRRLLSNVMYTPNREDSISETLEYFGYDPGDTDFSQFGWLSPLFGPYPLPEKMEVEVRFYSDRTVYDADAAALGLTNTSGYYDRENDTLGVYVDTQLFRWMGHQAGWSDRAQEEIVRQVQEYVNRVVIQALAHEIFHYLQDQSRNPQFSLPLTYEGSATFLEFNVLFREEISWLVDAYRSLNIQPELPGADTHPCQDLLVNSSPAHIFGMLELRSGANFVAENAVDIRLALSITPNELFALPKETREKFYDLGFFFVFFQVIEWEWWSVAAEEFLASGRPQDLPDGTEEDFQNFAKGFVHSLPDRLPKETLEYVLSLSSNCMREARFLSARAGAELAALRDDLSAQAYVYLGDLYWRLSQPLFALDYYVRALAAIDYAPPGEALRVEGRLGDAFEQLGDIDAALLHFEKCRNHAIQDVNYDIVRLRCALKQKIYSHPSALARWRTLELLAITNDLVAWLYGEHQQASAKKLPEAEIFELIEGKLNERIDDAFR